MELQHQTTNLIMNTTLVGVSAAYSVTGEARFGTPGHPVTPEVAGSCPVAPVPALEPNLPAARTASRDLKIDEGKRSQVR